MIDYNGRPIRKHDPILCELEGGPHCGEFRWFARERLLPSGEVELGDGSLYQIADRLTSRPLLLQHAPLKEALAERARRERR